MDEDDKREFSFKRRCRRQPSGDDDAVSREFQNKIYEQPCIILHTENNLSAGSEKKMKKTGITGIFIVLLIAVVLIAACTQEQAPGPETPS